MYEEGCVVRDRGTLRQMQSLPLDAKIAMSHMRIREWYEYFDGNVYISLSGKDSAVLTHLVHDFYPDVPMVFSNTGLEYPEIQAFAREMGATFVYPKMSFSEVISTYGYPIISKEVAESIYAARRLTRDKYGLRRRKRLTGKAEAQIMDQHKWLLLCKNTNFAISHKCCYAMKKAPLRRYKTREKRHPYVGTRAEESMLRVQSWIRNGCNAFDGVRKISQPISFWTEQDVLRYILREGVKIPSVYGDVVAVDDQGYQYDPILGMPQTLKCTGCQRTGCIFCGFGCHLEKGETRFQRLAKTHPKQYEYCMGGGQWVDNPKYDPVALKVDGDWENWNPKKVWVPSKKGLGMKKVFDDCNEIYGRDFIRYE